MQLNLIKQMERYARNDSAVVSLGQGIPAGKCDSYIHDFVAAAMRTEPHFDAYSDPQGLLRLRTTIAETLQAHHMSYQTDEIIVTCGAIEAINTALLALINSEKDEVIIPTPTYSAYFRAVALARGTTVPLPLPASGGWHLDMAQVSAAVTPKTAAILLCNPNNPTGTIYDQETLAALCELARSRHFFLIVDEVYGNMLYDRAELFTPAQLEQYRKQVIRVVSFSKDFNLTGWRIGFLHSDRSIVERLMPLHDTLVNCAPVPAQYAALAALEIADEVFARNKEQYRAKRNLMYHHMQHVRPWMECVLPSGGYFLFPKLVGAIDSDELCIRLATEAQVVVVPGSDFGIGGEQHIRFCFGRSVADINEGMRRVRTFLQANYADTPGLRYARERSKL